MKSRPKYTKNKIYKLLKTIYVYITLFRQNGITFQKPAENAQVRIGQD